jgi:hypothetical protein
VSPRRLTSLISSPPWVTTVLTLQLLPPSRSLDLLTHILSASNGPDSPFVNQDFTTCDFQVNSSSHSRLPTHSRLPKCRHFGTPKCDGSRFYRSNGPDILFEHQDFVFCEVGWVLTSLLLILDTLKFSLDNRWSRSLLHKRLKLNHDFTFSESS